MEGEHGGRCGGTSRVWSENEMNGVSERGGGIGGLGTSEGWKENIGMERLELHRMDDKESGNDIRFGHI